MYLTIVFFYAKITRRIMRNRSSLVEHKIYPSERCRFESYTVSFIFYAKITRCIMRNRNSSMVEQQTFPSEDVGSNPTLFLLFL